MSIPNTYTNKNETGCCAVPDVAAWDNQKVTFEDKLFVRLYTRSFFYVPLNIASVMTKLQQMVDAAGAAMPPEQAMILSHDLSPWKAEQLYAVSKPIDGADMVHLSGTYIAKVFEGPFQEAKNWYVQLQEAAQKETQKPGATYFFYTTCPKCAKHYGKNYVIGLAGV